MDKLQKCSECGAFYTNMDFTRKVDGKFYCVSCKKWVELADIERDL